MGLLGDVHEEVRSVYRLHPLWVVALFVQGGLQMSGVGLLGDFCEEVSILLSSMISVLKIV